MKYIVASGPVIIEEGNLLVVKEDKDDFYKLPGGTLEKGEDLEQACMREVEEEINGIIEIIKPLSPDVLWRDVGTDDETCIILVHYLADLINSGEIEPKFPIKDIFWLNINEIKQGMHNVAPNIMFLIDKGDIK